MEILSKSKVIVAMSGGVDSSVATAIAKEQGFEVIGATLKLKHPNPEFSKAQHCANKNDELAIESVVNCLGIEHVNIAAYSDFEAKVLRVCAEEYTQGRTPNPCCLCNPKIKFGKLVELAKERCAKYIMTGHYAQIVEIDSLQRLKRGEDIRKDQTYFLYGLTKEELSYLRFPVGAMTKDEVRKIAATLNLVTANKPDSQDACFQVENECFAETMRRLFNLPRKTGFFTYNGKIVGRHNGVHQFTIGQRKGLNVALGVPAYVRQLNIETGEVELVTDESKLLLDTFRLKNLNFHTDKIADEFECFVQIRYRSKAVLANVKRIGYDELIVTPKEPQRAVTSGQAGVLYLDDILLGGGIIDVN